MNPCKHIDSNAEFSFMHQFTDNDFKPIPGYTLTCNYKVIKMFDDSDNIIWRVFFLFKLTVQNNVFKVGFSLDFGGIESYTIHVDFPDASRPTYINIGKWIPYKYMSYLSDSSLLDIRCCSKFLEIQPRTLMEETSEPFPPSGIETP